MADKLELEVKASSRYAQMENDRRPFLERGRECSALTIPAVLSPSGFGKTSSLPTPYQSLGARGARTMASKFALSLFPGIPFFNYRVDDLTREAMGQQRGDIDNALAARERAVTTELDTCVFRPA